MLEKITSILKWFLRNRQKVKTGFSFKNCSVLFKRLRKFCIKLSYLYFTPTFPFVPIVGRGEKERIAPLFSFSPRIKALVKSTVNSLKIVDRVKESFIQRLVKDVKSPLKSPLFPNSFFLRINKLAISRSSLTIFQKSAGYAILSNRYVAASKASSMKFFKIFSSKLYSLIYHTSSSKVHSGKILIGKQSPFKQKVLLITNIRKIHQFFEKNRIYRLLKSELGINVGKFLLLNAQENVARSREGLKILKIQSPLLSRIYRTRILYDQRQIVKTLREKVERIGISQVISKTGVLQPIVEKNLLYDLTRKESSAINSGGLRFKVLSFKISEQISNIVRVRERSLRLASERVMPYTTYLTTGIREIRKKGGRPYTIYEYPRSSIMINMSMPAAAAGRPSTSRNINYTFRNVINVTVNVASLESDRDIRELGRKIGKILAEEARKYGVEL